MCGLISVFSRSIRSRRLTPPGVSSEHAAFAAPAFAEHAGPLPATRKTPVSHAGEGDSDTVIRGRSALQAQMTPSRRGVFRPCALSVRQLGGCQPLPESNRAASFGQRCKQQVRRPAARRPNSSRFDPFKPVDPRLASCTAYRHVSALSHPRERFRWARALAGLRTWVSWTRTCLPRLLSSGRSGCALRIGHRLHPHRGGTVPDLHRIPFSAQVGTRDSVCYIILQSEYTTRYSAAQAVVENIDTTCTDIGTGGAAMSVRPTQQLLNRTSRALLTR